MQYEEVPGRDSSKSTVYRSQHFETYSTNIEFPTINNTACICSYFRDQLHATRACITRLRLATKKNIAPFFRRSHAGGTPSGKPLEVPHFS